jgi:hypothetical protein
MDDDTFMANMNVNSSHSQEYWSQYGAPQTQQEDELDEDGEGLMDGPIGRAVNYTLEEDQVLCKAWCNIGMDPTVGADQNQETYWVRIKEYFDEENTSGIERSERSLRSRWWVINVDCQKWVAVQKNVDGLNPSGYAEVDRVNCVFSYVNVKFLCG